MSRGAPPTRRLLEVDFSLVDYDRMLDWIDDAIAAGHRKYACHVAVNALMNARRDPRSMAALRGSSLVLPDGMPIVWALRALGEEIPDRVYGPDLMLAACERSLRTGARHFLYGGRDESATQALEASFTQRFPGLAIAGSYTPPFRPLTEAEEADVCARVASSAADIVWVGIGSPKQETWMARMRERLDAAVLVGVGAAFDFHAGLVSQAPSWMQRNGLEWLFRLGREPRRLAPRYLRDNPRFVAAFMRQWLAERR